MSLDGIVIKSLVHEFNNTILNGKIDKIYQPEKDELLINIRNKGNNYRLLISSSSNNPRIYLTDKSKPNPITPPMFCMLLRKHLQGGKITKIFQYKMERILMMDVQSLDELGVLCEKRLVIEIMGRHSNIIVIDKESFTILDTIKRISHDVSAVRLVLPGIKYKFPPAQNKKNPLETTDTEFYELFKTINSGILTYKFIYTHFMGISPLSAKEICERASIDPNSHIGELNHLQKDALYNSFCNLMQDVKQNIFNPTIIWDKNKIIGFSSIDLTQYKNYKKTNYKSMSKILEEFYDKRDKLDRLHQKTTDLRKVIHNKLERNQKKLSKQIKELQNAKNREKYKVFGELITANIYKLNKGDTELEAINFYSENQDTIKIKLDKRLTPAQNAQKYFKRYNKLKTAYTMVSKQIKKTKSEIDYLENILVSIENSTEINDIDEIKEELRDEGILKQRKSFSKKKKKKSSSSPHHFLSSDGYHIYVGKNNKQNDYLTLKLADKNDLWFHTKDIPGSHVVLKNPGKNTPESTLLDAALLAAYYSKARLSSNVPVDYTQKKHVRKPNGAKPGMVIYDNNSTLYVTPREDLISNIELLKP
ncbi:Rqc2 family fibronectin-binding protein [Clostridiisalibacter paucivorans]|uniref:Rqc2 family fibronectin-binding protein n=1 Tax=Clostridiisalibacter paucivorans TaxID=408753 RepID=UPI00047CC301|nr:NFACT RNA binding domain-containing protein [Clostridiisalibacter paucivorans]